MMQATSSSKTPSEAINSATLSHFSTTSTVSLLVRVDEQQMTAHGIHLMKDSDFFVAALEKDWKESGTRTIKLPEETAASMAHYLSYQYGGKLFTEDIKSVPGAEIQSCFELLAILYVCGERFLNLKLQHAVLTEILRLSAIPDKHGKHWYPSAQSVNIMYRGTTEMSPSRRLLVDLHVASGERAWISYGGPEDFTLDMVNAVQDKLQEFRGRHKDTKVKDLKIEKYC
jgi:hypothetical protein